MDKSFINLFCNKLFESFKSGDEFSFENYLQVFLGDTQEVHENIFFKKPEWEDVKNNFFSLVYFYDEDRNQKKEFYGILFEKLCNITENMYSSILNSRFKDAEFTMKEYLEVYFDLLHCLLKSELINQEHFVYQELREQLLTGYMCNINKSKSLFYRFFSPVIIEKIMMIYDFTIQFKETIEEINEEHKMIKEIFKHLYFEKISRLFNMNIISSNKKHYVYTVDNRKYPIVCEREALSSIMMIKPIRWLDKIRAYVEEYDSQGNKYINQTVSLMILGYVKLESKNGTISSEELKFLDETLKELYPQTKFNFDVFINDKDPYYESFKSDIKLGWENSKFNICKKNHNEIISPIYIYQEIEKHDITLFLDSPCLYEHELMIEKWNSVENGISEKVPYRKVYDNLNKEDIVLPLQSKEVPIHRLISKFNVIGIDRRSQEMYFHYVLNDSFATYLQSMMTDKEETIKRKDVHILYSSTNSVANSSFALKNLAREERYKGKAFRLISFVANAKQDPKKLLLKQSQKNMEENFMIFSLWNMLKNIDITMADNVKWRKCLGTDSVHICRDLMNVFVKLYWSSDFKSFKYQIKTNASAKYLNMNVVKYSVNELLNAVLVYNSSSIGNCVLNSFYNTIYSQIKTLDDAVFYCLFRTRNWSVIDPSVLYDGEFSDEGKPVLSVNQPHRWTVVRVINELQKPSISLNQYYSIAFELKRNNYDAPRFMSDIYDICEKKGYKKCRLYQNLVKIIGLKE